MREAWKEGCTSLYFQHSLMLSVPCVALLLHVFIVEILADLVLTSFPGSIASFVLEETTWKMSFKVADDKRGLSKTKFVLDQK